MNWVWVKKYYWKIRGSLSVGLFSFVVIFWIPICFYNVGCVSPPFEFVLYIYVSSLLSFAVMMRPLYIPATNIEPRPFIRLDCKATISVYNTYI